MQLGVLPFLAPQARAQLLPASPVLACRDAMQRSAHKKSVPELFHKIPCQQRIVTFAFAEPASPSFQFKTSSIFILASRFTGLQDELQ
jgi:hypothetical protein